MILPIVKYPSEILRKKTNEVSFPLDKKTRALIKNMFQTVRAAKGIGLAAPQVNASLAVIVVDLEHLGLAPFALINPSITSSSKNTTELEEGCLSIPGVYGIVSRPEKITFSGYTLDGKQVQGVAADILSKVLQHEIDHINGVLILDKIIKYTQDGTGTKNTGTQNK